VKSVFLANAPNPFNPTTTITYTLPEPLRVTIRLYTAQGQLARTLVEEDMISPSDLELVRILDNPEDVVHAIFDYYQHRGFEPSARNADHARL
jgi:hypothetical protein